MAESNNQAEETLVTLKSLILTELPDFDESELKTILDELKIERWSDVIQKCKSDQQDVLKEIFTKNTKFLKLLGPQHNESYHIGDFDLASIEYMLHKMVKLAGKKDGGEILLVIGNTGAGKSTLINYLLCNVLELVEDDDTGDKFARLKDPSELKQVAKIGQTVKSETLYPSVFQIEKKNIFVCDCPGFGDNQGGDRDICISLALANIVKRHQKIKVMIVVDKKSIDTDRGMGLRALSVTLSRIFTDPVAMANKILVVITKSEGAAKENQIKTKLKKYAEDYCGQLEKTKITGSSQENEIRQVLFILQIMKDASMIIVDIFDDGKTREEITQKLQQITAAESSTNFNFMRTENILKFLHTLTEKAGQIAGLIWSGYSLLVDIERLQREKASLTEKLAKDEKAKIERVTNKIAFYEAEKAQYSEELSQFEETMGYVQDELEILHQKKKDGESDEVVSGTLKANIEQAWLWTSRFKKCSFEIPAVSYTHKITSQFQGSWNQISEGDYLFEATFNADRVLFGTDSASGEISLYWKKKDIRINMEQLSLVKDSIDYNKRKLSDLQNSIINTKAQIRSLELSLENVGKSEVEIQEFEKRICQHKEEIARCDQSILDLTKEREQITKKVKEQSPLCERLIALNSTNLFSEAEDFSKSIKTIERYLEEAPKV